MYKFVWRLVSKPKMVACSSGDLATTEWGVGFRFPGEVTDLSLLHSVQTDDFGFQRVPGTVFLKRTR
jgi:hypothetical protein